jgi:hypothetical protein
MTPRVRHLGMAASQSSHQPIVKKTYMSEPVTLECCHIKNFKAACSPPAVVEQRTLDVFLNMSILKHAPRKCW